MWILFLAVASFHAFVSIVLSLCVANAREARKTFRKSETHAGPSFAVLSITQAFEPVFSVLWEAPIHALELIRSGGSGVPRESIHDSGSGAGLTPDCPDAAAVSSEVDDNPMQ